MQKYAPLVLRIGLAFVFLWFGYTQVTGPDAWTRLIPEALVNLTGISAHTFVLINGSAEIIGAILILFGIFTRVAASLLFLHMISIVFVVGLSAIGVRDIGIATGCLALSLLGKKLE